MAGITAMGDLSHELETLVLQIDSGAVAGDDHAHAVMQASLDELSRMRDLVSAGTLPGEARDLIAQIRGLANQPAGHGRRAGPRAAAAAPAAPPVAQPRAAPTAPRRRRSSRARRRARAPLAPPARAAAPESSPEPAALSEDASQPGIEQRAGIAGPRGAAGRAGGNGARGCRPARHHAQQCRRGEHLSRPPRSASQFDRFQSGRAGANRNAPEGAIARPGNRDRSASIAPAPGYRTAAR